MQRARSAGTCPRVVALGTRERPHGVAFCAANTTALPAFNILEWFDPKKAEAALEKRFDDIVERVEEAAATIPKQIQRELYGFYQQAIKGNATGGPGFFGSKRRYDAWKANLDMDKVEAMKKYIELALKYLDEQL